MYLVFIAGKLCFYTFAAEIEIITTKGRLFFFYFFKIRFFYIGLINSLLLG